VLLCDTPVEGGSTSRFVDSSLRRFEVITTAAFRQQHRLQLQARPLQLPAGDAERPVAVRYRQEALFPCLHPCLPVQIPLQLDLLAAAGGQPLRSWRLWQECDGFEALTAEEAAPSASQPVATPLRGAFQDCCSIDLRL